MPEGCEVAVVCNGEIYGFRPLKKELMDKGYEFPEVTSWIRASKKDFELVRTLGLQETGILVSCSDYHIFYKLKMLSKVIHIYVIPNITYKHLE